MGSRLLPLLLEDPAVSVVRSGGGGPLPEPASPNPKLRHVQADLSSDAARAALAGVDVLYHLGYALWRGADASRANDEGTRTVLAAHPGRVVFASSAAVYGAWPDNPLPLTEDWWPRPNDECSYAGDKLRTERLLASEVPTLSLRIAAVLGPHADPRVAKAVKGYRLAVPAFRAGKEALQFLGEDDAARALHLGAGSVATGVVNIAPADWLDAAGVGRVAGGRVLRLPGSVLMGISEVGYRLRMAPFGRDRAVLIKGPLALSPAKAESVLGWTPAASSASVLAAAVSR